MSFKINLDTIRTTFDKVADYIPLLSTVTNLIDLFQKWAFQDTELKATPRSVYYEHLKDKDNNDCVLLLIPVFGNIYVYVNKRLSMADFKKLDSDKQVEYAGKRLFNKDYEFFKELDEDQQLEVLKQRTPELTSYWTGKDFLNFCKEALLTKNDEFNNFVESNISNDESSSKRRLARAMEKIIDIEPTLLFYKEMRESFFEFLGTEEKGLGNDFKYIFKSLIPKLKERNSQRYDQVIDPFFKIKFEKFSSEEKKEAWVDLIIANEEFKMVNHHKLTPWLKLRYKPLDNNPASIKELSPKVQFDRLRFLIMCADDKDNFGEFSKALLPKLLKEVDIFITRAIFKEYSSNPTVYDIFAKAYNEHMLNMWKLDDQK